MWRNRLEYLLILLGLLAFYLFFSGYLSFFLLAFFLALPVFSLLFTALSGRKRAVLFTEAPVSAAGGQFALFAELSGKPGKDSVRMEKIEFVTEDGEKIEFYVEEATRVNGVSYLLVTDSDKDEANAYILRDMSADGDSLADYAMVEDEVELEAVSRVFEQMLEDVDIR